MPRVAKAKSAASQRPSGLATDPYTVGIRQVEAYWLSDGKDSVLARSSFYDSNTALSDREITLAGAKPQVVSEAKEHFRKRNDVSWRWTTVTGPVEHYPEGQRGGVHQFDVVPKGNSNFAWVQHFIHHLAPQGMADFVLANVSMSSNQSGEREIQKAIIPGIF